MWEGLGPCLLPRGCLCLPMGGPCQGLKSDSHSAQNLARGKGLVAPLVILVPSVLAGSLQHLTPQLPLSWGLWGVGGREAEWELFTGLRMALWCLPPPSVTL